MTLRTRQPTGLPAYPLILVEGEEKAGKSTVSLSLSASEKVGRSFVFDLGDGAADEYAALGNYEVVDLDGTYTDLKTQVFAACDEPQDDDRPNLIVLDSGTQLWDLLKGWTDTRARNSKAGQKILREDPDAEVDAAMNLWNDAKDRWGAIVSKLRRWPGIAVITAQGQEVSKVQGGRPVAGQTEWSIQAEKTLAATVTAWVRVKRDPRTATLIGARRMGLDLPRGGLELPTVNTLEHLVFDVFGAKFSEVAAAPTQVGLSVAQAKTRLLDAVKVNGPDLSDDEATAYALTLWGESGIEGPEVSASVLAELLAKVSDG